MIDNYGGENPDHGFSVFNVCTIARVQRLQRYSSCYFQAPAVLQCYMIQFATGEYKGMVDISNYVRNNYDSEQLSAFLIKDQGGRFAIYAPISSAATALSNKALASCSNKE